MTIDTEDMQATAQMRRAERVAKISGPRGAKRGPASWAGETAAIYCRISHIKDEDQTGVDRQERICREIAERLKLVVVPHMVFVDNNRSAWQKNRKRPGWDTMLKAIDEGQVSHVLTYHPDRLMRQPADLETLLTKADENRITLHGEAGGRDLTDPDDRFILRIEVAHACRSSDDTSRRLKDEMADRARDGRPHTGIRRYGYDKTGMVIDKDEAEVVEWVFARYLDGAPAQALAADLNWLGIQTAQGREWTGVSIRSLLDSNHVAGLRVFRGEEIGSGTWPAIIDVGMFREVQERRSYRADVAKTKNKPKHGFYLCRSLVWCTRCARRMSGSSIGTQSLLCGGGGKRGAGCGRRISAKVLDGFVSEAAIRLLETLDITGREAATALSASDVEAIDADREQLAELGVMWAKKEISTSEFKEMRKVIEDRIAGTQRKAIIRPAAEVLRGMVGPNARASWKELEDAQDYQRLNALLRFLFAAIRIDESTTRGRKIDYGRISIEPNPLS